MPAERRLVIALFAIALGARILFGIFAETRLDAGPGLETREFLYAQDIASGFGWIATPVSAISPGYPALLALFYLLAFKNIWLTFFLQAALSSLTAVVLYRVARANVGRVTATVAALWLAIQANHLLFSSLFLRDVLSTLLLLVLLFMLTRPFARMRFAAISGVVFAALFHVDPQYILLTPVFGALVFFKTRHRILNIQYFFLFMGFAVLASVPWTVRNAVVYEQPIPVGLEAVRYLRPLKVVVSDTERTVSAVQSRIESASRTHRVQQNVAEFWRIGRFKEGAPPADDPSSPGAPAWSWRHNLISIVDYGLLLPFLIAGAVLAIRRRDRAIIMMLVVLLAYFVMCAWLGGSERARLAVDPLIIMVAFYGLEAISARRSRPVISSGTGTPM